MSRIPLGSAPRERMWNESRQVPRLGWSAASDDPPRVVVVAHVAAPRERLVGDPDAALGGRARPARAAARRRARRRRSRAARRSSRRAPCRRRAPPSPRTSPPRGAGWPRSAPRAPPRSRATAGRARSPARAPRQRARTSAGVCGEAIRSGSNSSTASKPAAAAARQLLLERPAQADGGDRAAHAAPARRRGRSIRSRSGRAPVNSSSEPAACSATIAPPSSVRQPRSARVLQQLGLAAACRRPRRPRGAGRSSSGGTARAGVGGHAGRRRVDEPVGVGRARLERRRPPRRGARAPRRAAAARSLARRRRTLSRSAPEREHRVGDRRARPAGAEQHDALGARARQAALERLAEAARVGVVADRAPVAQHDRVDRAERGRLGRQLVELVDHELLARVRDVEPAQAGARASRTSAPTSLAGRPSSSRSSSRYS